MQENRFEKKVQQQMEELRFSPSANVWKSVEEELDKRRRKRRVLYISIAAVLLIAAGLGLLLFRCCRFPATDIFCIGYQV